MLAAQRAAAARGLARHLPRLRSDEPGAGAAALPVRASSRGATHHRRRRCPRNAVPDVPPHAAAYAPTDASADAIPPPPRRFASPPAVFPRGHEYDLVVGHRRGDVGAVAHRPGAARRAVGDAVALGAIIRAMPGRRAVDRPAGRAAHPPGLGGRRVGSVRDARPGSAADRQDAVVLALVVYRGRHRPWVESCAARCRWRCSAPLAYPSLIGRLAFPMLLGQAGRTIRRRSVTGAVRWPRRIARLVLDGDRHAGVQRGAGAVRARPGGAVGARG